MATLRFETLSVSKAIAPEKLSRILAVYAKGKRDSLIKSGAASPSYITYVDGREGADEFSVRPDGAIRYVFSLIARAAVYAFKFASSSSPRVEGQFEHKWTILVNGSVWRGKDADIPSNAVIHVVNLSDHARITEVGRRTKLGLGHKLVEKTVKMVRRRFPTVLVSLEFIDIGSGYRLQKTRGRRKSQQAGTEITYPAVKITQSSSANG